MPCSECQAYQINYDWLTHSGDGSRQQRHGADWKREGPAPCQERPNEAKPICPKGCPEKEADYQLSPSNAMAWELFMALQAGAEMTPAEKSDALLRRKLAVIAGIWERHRQSKQSEVIGDLARVMAGAMR